MRHAGVLLLLWESICGIMVDIGHSLSLAVKWAEDQSGLDWHSGDNNVTNQADPCFGITDNLIRVAAHKMASSRGAPNKYIVGWRATNDTNKNVPCITWGMYSRGGESANTFQQISMISHVEPVKLELTPNLVDYSWFDNRLGNSETHYQAQLSESVEETVGISWNKSLSVGVSESMSVKVGEGPIEATDETTLSVSATVGEDQSSSKTIALGQSASVDKDVPAHQLDAAVLIASKGDLQLKVTYHIQLSGDIILDWGHRNQSIINVDGFHGSYRYTAIDIASLLGWEKKPVVFTTDAIVTCGFFGSSDLRYVSDVASKDIDTLKELIWGGEPKSTILIGN